MCVRGAEVRASLSWNLGEGRPAPAKRQHLGVRGSRGPRRTSTGAEKCVWGSHSILSRLPQSPLPAPSPCKVLLPPLPDLPAPTLTLQLPSRTQKSSSADPPGSSAKAGHERQPGCSPSFSSRGATSSSLAGRLLGVRVSGLTLRRGRAETETWHGQSAGMALAVRAVMCPRGEGLGQEC